MQVEDYVFQSATIYEYGTFVYLVSKTSMMINYHALCEMMNKSALAFDAGNTLDRAVACVGP